MKLTNTVLAGILLLQVGVLAAQKVLFKPDYAPRATVTGTKLFPDLKADLLGSITIKQDGRTTELKREGQKWVVASEGNALADAAACDAAATQLEKLAPGFIVSEKSEKHEQFDVAGKNAVEVSATNTAGVKVAHFVIGKTTADWRNSYIRTPAESTDVLKLATDIRHTFCREDTKLGAWRDKTIFTADAKNLRKIELVRSDETIVIERQLTPSTEKGKEGQLVATDDDVWKITAPFALDLEKYMASAMARNLATLTCDGFASADQKPADLGLEPPLVKVKGTLADGSALELELGKEDAGKTWARRPAGEAFQAMSYKLSNMVKKSAEFKPPEAPTTDPAAGTTPADGSTPPGAVTPPATNDGSGGNGGG